MRFLLLPDPWRGWRAVSAARCVFDHGAGRLYSDLRILSTEAAMRSSADKTPSDCVRIRTHLHSHLHSHLRMRP